LLFVPLENLPDVDAGSRAILSTGNTTNLCDHNNDNKKAATTAAAAATQQQQQRQHPAAAAAIKL